MDVNLIPKINNYFYEINSNNEVVFYYHKLNYTIKGDSVNDVIEILPFLDGKYTLLDISEKIKIDINYLQDILQLLLSKKIISFNNLRMNLSTPLNYQEQLMQILQRKFPEQNVAYDIQSLFSKKLFLMGKNNLVNSLEKELINYFEIVDDVNQSDMVIAVDFFENTETFLDANKYSMMNSIPFFKCVLESEKISVGPIFSNESLCYECYASRIISNLNRPKLDWGYYQKYHKNNDENFLFPGIQDIFINLISINIIKYFSVFFECRLFSGELVINPITMESDFYTCLRVPNCNVCSNTKVSERIK